MNRNEKIESTFVSLDLSEFSAGPKATESASAQLMKLKEKEALHKQNEEEEEQIIQIGAANKVRGAMEKLETQKKQGQNNVANVLFEAVLTMHGNDYAGARKGAGIERTKAQRKNSSRARKTKKGITKKAKRCKF